MNSFLDGSSIVLVLALSALLVPQVRAQQTTPSIQATNPPAVQDVSLAVPSQGSLNDILKMLDAGVSKDVVRIYIENSRTLYNLSAEDIIRLKQRAVPDEITTALLKKDAETKRLQTEPPAGPTPASGGAATQSVVVPLNYGGLQPDSYAYFYHYYLHPRALASAYQRLGVYGPGYPYGFAAPYRPYGSLRYPGFVAGPGWGY